MATSKTAPPKVLMKKSTPLTREELVAVRRDIHRHPEVGYEEKRTAKIVQMTLKELGWKPKVMAGTGVAATLGKSGPTIMIRCDLDALPLQEENTHEYRSRHDGTMHACGHDLHTSILLGTAKNLIQDAPPQGRVKLNFQPAEEGLNGAGAMIKAGIMDSPKVDAVLGYHIWQEIPAGKVGVVTGPAMAAVDRFRVTLTGKGGHAAYPQQSVDPIVAGAQLVTALQSIVSRNVDPLDTAVLTVGRMEAGTTFNIIPPKVELEGTVRTFTKATRRLIEKRFRAVVTGIARATGTRAEIEFVNENGAVVNDAAMSEFMRDMAREVVGKRNLVPAAPSMGGEDHSLYQELVPGCYVFVGAGVKKGEVFPHHHPMFNPSEDALEIGAELMTRSARAWLARN